MKKLLVTLGAGTLGYVLGAMAGYLLVQAFSANTHDREMEALMTGFFFSGPATALIAFAVSLCWK